MVEYWTLYSSLNYLSHTLRRMLKKLSSKLIKTRVQVQSGYGSGFFKAAWDIVGKDITDAILEFLHNGRLLKQLNSTNIALIPKTAAPKRANQYRPISCCNVLYKCISKMIYTRLKDAISVIVADNQSAIVQGRSIVHNVLICHDLLRHCGGKLHQDA